MKRILAIALALACIMAAACTGPNPPAEPTPEPTSAVTVEPTAGPTAEPTPEPTPAFTAEPTAEPTPRPVFPTPGPTGVLTDGPIFTEPAKYLVIDGESDLHYVYDAAGELVCSFRAGYADDPSYYTEAGFYTEFGLPYDFDLSVMRPGKHYEMLGDILFAVEYMDDFSDGMYLTEVADAERENVFTFEKGEMPIGNLGGILHIDGKYLLIDRGYEHTDYGEACFAVKRPAKLYDEDFNFIREIDTAPFGDITGVFGGRYVIGCVPGEGEDPYEKTRNSITSIYTLDGELVMENVKPTGNSQFFPDDEVWFAVLSAADYLTDADGRVFDGELRELPELPKDAEIGFLKSRYKRIELPEVEFVRLGAYAGTRDADGSWLFRIYDPRKASDSRPQGWWD